MISEIPGFLNGEVVCTVSEFRTVESAIKAVVDLSRRYFSD